MMQRWQALQINQLKELIYTNWFINLYKYIYIYISYLENIWNSSNWLPASRANTATIWQKKSANTHPKSKENLYQIVCVVFLMYRFYTIYKLSDDYVTLSNAVFCNFK